VSPSPSADVAGASPRTGEAAVHEVLDRLGVDLRLLPRRAVHLPGRAGLSRPHALDSCPQRDQTRRRSNAGGSARRWRHAGGRESPVTPERRGTRRNRDRARAVARRGNAGGMADRIERELAVLPEHERPPVLHSAAQRSASVQQPRDQQPRDDAAIAAAAGRDTRRTTRRAEWRVAGRRILCWRPATSGRDYLADCDALAAFGHLRRTARRARQATALAACCAARHIAPRTPLRRGAAAQIHSHGGRVVRRPQTTTAVRAESERCCACAAQLRAHACEPSRRRRAGGRGRPPARELARCRIAHSWPSGAAR
jgi:hypothetical protein